MKCSSCGKELTGNVKFCIYCGTPVSSTQKKENLCASCGKKLISGYKFCIYCGARVDTAAGPEEAAASKESAAAEETAETQQELKVNSVPRMDKRQEPVASQNEDVSCPSCGADFRAGDKFCRICGAKIDIKPKSTVEAAPEEKLCTACGAALKPGQRFCIYCGTPVESSPTQKEESRKDTEDLIKDLEAADITEEDKSEASVPMEIGKAGEADSAEKPVAEVPAGDSEPEPDVSAGGSYKSEKPEVQEEPEAAEVQEEQEESKKTEGPASVSKIINTALTEPSEETSPNEGEAADNPLDSAKHTVVLTNLDMPELKYVVPIQNEIRIGRMWADIIIADDPEVSRTHCRVLLKEEQLYLIDEASKNGTIYRNRRISSEQETAFRNGDIVRIGRHAYSLELK